MIIKDCIVTKSDSNVIREYVTNKKSDLYKKYGSYNSGIELETKEVYNAFDGKVMNVNYDDNKYSVIVQLDSNNCIKYSGLKDVNIKLGDVLNSGDYIGSCKKSVKVEYGNKVESKFPIRILKTTFYKQDPTDLLITGKSPVKDDLRYDYINYDSYDIYDDVYMNGDVIQDPEYMDYKPDFNTDIFKNAEDAKKSGDYYGGDI